MTTALSVLLVEDHYPIATSICDYLTRHGVQTDFAADGKTGLQLALQQPYDVIVLDLMLPDGSGIQICQQLKQQCDPIPAVLMLTARDSIADKTEGFHAGADDYLTKPFELTELLLRCQALARRRQLHHSSVLCLGDLHCDTRQQQVSRAGIPIPLSATDYHILLMLLQAYPQAVSRQQLLNRIWQDDPPDSDVLRSHIYTLRQALDKPFDRPLIVTLHGIGFKLQLTEAPC